MEDRLKGLKKSMDKTSFSKLNFTEKHRKTIQERMLKAESEEVIFIAALQLLVHEKTGYELVKLLRG